MNDMSAVIVPKSDQINADDLISGPMTITIREVHIKRGDEQPVDIYFDGSQKAYRPCKSMSRVLVGIWGPDAGKYNGRSLTLYRDPNVRFGKDAVGGIRISHMTDIPAEKLDNGKVVMSLTATRAQRKPHVVRPLVLDNPQPRQQTKQTPAQWVAEHKEVIDTATTTDELDEIERRGKPAMGKLEAQHPDLHAEVMHAYQLRREALVQEGPDDSQRGDGFDEDRAEVLTGYGEE